MKANLAHLDVIMSNMSAISRVHGDFPTRPVVVYADDLELHISPMVHEDVYELLIKFNADPKTTEAVRKVLQRPIANGVFPVLLFVEEPDGGAIVSIAEIYQPKDEHIAPLFREPKKNIKDLN